MSRTMWFLENRILKKSFFITDPYHTSDNTPHLLLDRLALSTRLFFMSKYVSILLKCRREALKGRFDTQDWIMSSFDILKLIEGCGGKFHITGLENIRQCQGPVVFVSNHMSTLETMVFPCIIAPIKEVVFIVKDSIVKHPFFGPVMRSRHPIIVSRSNSREDFKIVMDRGQELLATGTSIMIFPQSRRTVEFKPEDFNSLGVKLASRAGVQIVPIAIKTDFWGNGKYLKELGAINRHKPIYMSFGKPLSVNGPGKEEHKKIISFIASNLMKWSDDAA